MQLRNSLVGWLGRQSPYALIRPPNPVFDCELRRTGFPVRPEMGRRYRRSLLWGLLLLCVVSWIFDPKGNLLNLLFIPAAIIAAFVFDMYYMLQTVSSIGQQITSGEWDLLRLTPLRMNDILAAKYAIGQLRAWRVMFVELALRLGGVALTLVALLVSLFSHVMPRDMLNSTTAALLFFFVTFSIIYVLEPLWRMRAVVALGLAISARVHNPASAILVSFATLLTMRLSQALICVSISVLAVPLVGFLSSWNISPRSPDLSDLLGYVLMWVVISLTVYGFYKILEDISLRRAFWFAFRNDQ